MEILYHRLLLLLTHQNSNPDHFRIRIGFGELFTHSGSSIPIAVRIVKYDVAYVDKKFWEIGSMAIVIWQGVGEFILSLIAMPIINSSSSSILILSLCAFPSLICGVFLSYFVESPRFLYGQNKLKALSILSKIAEKNKMERLVINLKRSSWI